MRAPVNGGDVEPAVLLVQERDVLAVLHDLDGMRTAHRTQQTERQAGSGIVALGRSIVGFPLLLSPGGEGQVLYALAAGFVLGNVGHARGLPDSAEVGLTI